MIRAVAAGAVLAMGVASSAWAVPSLGYYETSSGSPAAPGATGTTGGLCSYSTSPSDCTSLPNANLTAGPLSGTSPNYYIALTSPFNTTGVYSLAISIAGHGTTAEGANWTVSLINPTNDTGVSLFTTPGVSSTTVGGGSMTETLTGNGTFDIGITELATSTSPYQIFSLTYSITAAPEPATFGLLAAGIAALGMVRRRRAGDH
jgi:PEP-CTERM motif